MVDARDIVAQFARSVRAEYLVAFKDEAGLLPAAGIDRPLRLAHFMAQVLHETGGLTIAVESGRYTEEALGRMWDAGNWRRYLESRAACVAMARQCRIDGGAALFSLVYGNRMGNGPPPTRDGWTYRGRGLLQTTGRDAYARFGKRYGVDFVGQPDLLASADHALKPALAEWSDRHCNAAADRNDIERVTRSINGGTVGLAARKAWFAKIWPFVIGAPPASNAIAWKVQAALARLGYDCSDPDGAVGPRTRLAILAYREKNRLPPTPAIQDDLLASLGIACPATAWPCGGAAQAGSRVLVRSPGTKT